MKKKTELEEIENTTEDLTKNLKDLAKHFNPFLTEEQLSDFSTDCLIYISKQACKLRKL